MGSHAYGVAENDSDQDIYCVYIPSIENVISDPKEYIHGFGKKFDPLQSWQQHHIEYNGCSYDVSFYSIQKYFDLCMSCNPNMLDSLFTYDEDVLFISEKFKKVKDQRSLFLSREVYSKFRGFAYSEFNKWEKDKIDMKRAYHMIRMLIELETCLSGNLDLKSNPQLLIDIRKNKFSSDEIIDIYDKLNDRIEKNKSDYEKLSPMRYDQIHKLLFMIVFFD